jgi:hypothetical protein
MPMSLPVPPPLRQETHGAWSQVRPDELAARFDWDADALMDDLNPEDFTEEQANLALAAIDCCRGSMPALAIRIDPDVYVALRERIARYSDTPNGVLRRLLGFCDARPVPSRRKSRARKGTLLPLDRYDFPLLRALVEDGGSLPTQAAIDAVGAALAAEFTPADHEPLTSGSPRWRDRIHLVRLRLIAQGLVARDSRWGVWSITEKGRQALSLLSQSHL